MTVPPRYDPSLPLGEGRTIIEASAGTGKTFTIAAAVTRLVAADGLTMEEILVVTFTRAATAELKDRVRRRMVRTLRALRGDPGRVEVDEHMAVLVSAPPADRDRYAERLDRAVTRFDRAQIFTIHGFSRRILLELGFRSRLAGELEPHDLDELLLRRAAGDLMLDRFTEGSEGDIEAIRATDLEVIGKALASTPDARIVPEPNGSGDAPRMRARLARDMRQLVARGLLVAGSVTFDDILVEARDALTDPDTRDHARSLLRRRYSVALVDEAQDTDPIQWEVIRSVFDESRLVVIGDPKQSIYAFRGADIESYLSAVDGAGAHYTLDTNWRSDGPLIEALDFVLAGTTFGDDRIGYRRVRPAPRHEHARISGAGAALRIRRLADDFPMLRTQRGFLQVGAARSEAAADAANEAARMLMSGAELVGAGGRRAVEPGDIAVLCRTRSQVEMVREELRARGVPSVAARTGGVFESPAAEEWRRFLMAVERPQRFDYVRMALTTCLAGLGLAEVADLSDDQLREHQQRFLRWQALLHDRGIPAMFKDVDLTTGMTAQVLSRSGGERMLTDLSHIAEEMHSVWRRGRVGSLVVWLEAAIDEAARNAKANAEDPEDRQRRLETDAAAVQVQTIHAAKGLEYPVVLAPFLWDSFQMKPSIPVFHEQFVPEGGGPRRRLVDVGGRSHPDFKAHQKAAMAERDAEESRLLYVAMTRARHSLVVWWVGNTWNAGKSKLSDLILRMDARLDPARSLRMASEGSLEVETLSGRAATLHYRPRERESQELDLARLDRTLDYAWRRASFSSLSPAHPLAGADDTAEEADRTDESEDGAPAEPSGATPQDAADGPVGMARLPRGARFGSLVHSILERVPFDAPDPAELIRAEYHRLARHSSWDLDVEDLASGLVAMLETPLGPGGADPRLCDLGARAYVKEMSFELPVCSADSVVSLSGVAAAALDHLPPDDPYRPYFSGLAEQEWSGFRGYLTGIVDLAVALPGPDGERYYVADFKSNALAPWHRDPTIDDYGPELMNAAMEAGNYVLQSLLYQVALHRYLRHRLPGYRPERHLGGSLYLFVRGMIGPQTPVIDGERCGVARWSTPPRAVEAVSELLTRGEP